MSWNDTKCRRYALAAAAAAAIGGVANAATMVVRSTGPSAKLYPAGKALPDGAKLVLKANDTVVLLDGKGTRSLSGPGVFGPDSPPSQAAGVGTTLASLAGASGARRARIGAVRGAGAATPGKNPNVWFVDTTKSATVCVADPAAVTMWRPGTDEASATIAGAGKTETATWVKGQNAKAWPAALPITDGATYSVAWAGSAAPMKLTFALVGAPPAGIEDMAALLIKRGCTAQLDMLIETVAVPPPPVNQAG